jgi:uncharacterized membrane protein YoaK (UPF0700 family)
MMPAVTLGLALTLVFWVLGQDLGALYSGHATDPNAGPVLALMAIALLALAAAPRAASFSPRRARRSRAA